MAQHGIAWHSQGTVPWAQAPGSTPAESSDTDPHPQSPQAFWARAPPLNAHLLPCYQGPSQPPTGHGATGSGPKGSCLLQEGTCSAPFSCPECSTLTADVLWHYQCQAPWKQSFLWHI